MDTNDRTKKGPLAGSTKVHAMAARVGGLLLTILIALSVGCAGDRGEDTQADQQATAADDALEDIKKKSEALALETERLHAAQESLGQAYADVAPVLTPDEEGAAQQALNALIPNERAAYDTAVKSLGEAFRARFGSPQMIEDFDVLYEGARSQRFIGIGVGKLLSRNVPGDINQALEQLAPTSEGAAVFAFNEWMLAHKDSALAKGFKEKHVLDPDDSESVAKYSDAVLAPAAAAAISQALFTADTASAVDRVAALYSPADPSASVLLIPTQTPVPVGEWWVDSLVGDVMHEFYNKTGGAVDQRFPDLELVHLSEYVAKDPMGVRPAVEAAIRETVKDITVSTPFESPQRVDLRYQVRGGQTIEGPPQYAASQAAGKALGPAYADLFGADEGARNLAKDMHYYTDASGQRGPRYAQYVIDVAVEFSDAFDDTPLDSKVYVAGTENIGDVFKRVATENPGLRPDQTADLTRAAMRGAVKELEAMHAANETTLGNEAAARIRGAMDRAADEWIAELKAQEAQTARAATVNKWIDSANRVMTAVVVAKLLYDISKDGITKEDVLPFAIGLGFMALGPAQAALNQFVASAQAALPAGAQLSGVPLAASAASQVMGKLLPAIAIVMNGIGVARAKHALDVRNNGATQLAMAGAVLSLVGSVLVVVPGAAPVAVVVLITGTVLSIAADIVADRIRSEEVRRAKDVALSKSAMPEALKGMLTRTNAPGQLRRQLARWRSSEFDLSAEQLRELALAAPAVVGGLGPAPSLDGFRGLRRDFSLTPAEELQLLKDDVGASGARSFMVHQFTDWCLNLGTATGGDPDTRRDLWLSTMNDAANSEFQDADYRAAFAAARARLAQIPAR